jgi:hypothetical protein
VLDVSGLCYDVPLPQLKILLLKIPHGKFLTFSYRHSRVENDIVLDLPIKVRDRRLGSSLPGSGSSIKKVSSLRVSASENSPVAYH